MIEKHLGRALINGLRFNHRSNPWFRLALSMLRSQINTQINNKITTILESRL
jgi:hypothetical protein